MAADLVFYTNPMSRGRIVRWMLEEVGVPYEAKVLDYGAMKSSDYRAVNPMGKVPAIVHNGVAVTEAAAICAYLADAFPEKGLAPSSDQRGAYYRWLFYGAGPVEAAVTNKSFGWEPDPKKRAMLGYGSFGDVMDVLEQAVSERSFLAGDRFSAADVYTGSQIGWGLQFGSIEKRPAFERYWSGLTARPAYKRAAEIDDKLIPARR